MDKKILTAANALTAARIVLAVNMLFWPTLSVPFAVFYLLAGLTDMADGFAARITHTESAVGAKLDSTADAVFFAVCALKILPRLSLDGWIWAWIILIAVMRIAAAAVRVSRSRSYAPPHTPADKLTGLLLFLFPMAIPLADIDLLAAIICVFATAAAVKTLLLAFKK